MLRTGRILEHEYGNTFPCNVGGPVVPKCSQLAQLLPGTIIVCNNYALDVTKKQDMFTNLNDIAKIPLSQGALGGTTVSPFTQTRQALPD